MTATHPIFKSNTGEYKRPQQDMFLSELIRHHGKNTLGAMEWILNLEGGGDYSSSGEVHSNVSEYPSWP